MYYKQLRDNLHAVVPYPPNLATSVREIDGLWRDFCSLPLAIKQLFGFRKHHPERDPGYVMRRKTEPGDRRDDKEYFHYLPDNEDILKYYELDKIISEHPVIQRFFECAARIEHETFRLVLQIGEVLERDVPGIVDQLHRGKPHFAYRYLKYTPQASNDTILSAPHFDRSGFTLHLYESCSGLQMLNWNEEWVNVPRYEDRTVIFAGYRLEALTRRAIQKTWHRVERQGAALGNETRTSLVLFTPLVDAPDYGSEIRAQDMQPGYCRVPQLTS